MADHKHRLAVFDIDGTIFRSSLLIELINELVREKVFPEIARQEIESDFRAWLNRVGPYSDYINKVVQVHLKYLANCSHNQVLAAARKVIKNEKDKVYRYTRDLIFDLKTQGYILMAISGSPSYMVKMFAQYLKFDCAFGQEFEVVDHHFTGVAINRDTVENKKKVIMDFLASTKTDFNLKKSLAVGDSMSDLSMLEMVGIPIAFNPELALAKLASQRGWKIVVERKDVIYDITSCNFIENNNPQILKLGDWLKLYDIIK